MILGYSNHHKWGEKCSILATVEIKFLYKMIVQNSPCSGVSILFPNFLKELKKKKRRKKGNFDFRCSGSHKVFLLISFSIHCWALQFLEDAVCNSLREGYKVLTFPIGGTYGCYRERKRSSWWPCTHSATRCHPFYLNLLKAAFDNFAQGFPYTA